MGMIGIRLYAEDVNIMSDLVLGPPGALSHSLYARAVLGNLGSSVVPRLVCGVRNVHIDWMPLRSGINYTYRTVRTGKRGVFPKSVKTQPIFTENHMSGEFVLIWESPEFYSDEIVKDVRRQVLSIPFLGGRVVLDRGLRCEALTEKEASGFLNEFFLSEDQHHLLLHFLQESKKNGLSLNLRDVLRAVSWQRVNGALPESLKAAIPGGRSEAKELEDSNSPLSQLRKAYGNPNGSVAPFPWDHPLTRFVSERKNLRFQPVGYRQLGQARYGRPGMRETGEDIPHAYVETLYGVHRWRYWRARSKDTPIDSIPWWEVHLPENNPILYVVKGVHSLQKEQS